MKDLAGHSLTFGSETSTSGRLMPQYFMEQGGLAIDDLKGKPGFSGSHDATIEAVAAGSFEVGAVNEQVWEATEGRQGRPLRRGGALAHPGVRRLPLAGAARHR